MTIEPIATGHTLVVPIAEVDHWIDLDPQLSSHLFMVAKRIGLAIDRAFQPVKVAMMIVGDEVPHVHIHLIPFDSAGDLTFAKASLASPEDLEAAARLISERVNQ